MNKKNLGLGIAFGGMNSPAIAALNLTSKLGDTLQLQVDEEASLRTKKVKEMEKMASMTGAVGALLGGAGDVNG